MSLQPYYKNRRLDREMGFVRDEILSARVKHPPFNSLHEGYGVLLEEVEEFWDEVKKKSSERDPRDVRTELQQVAAMALAIIVELTPPPEEL